MHLTDEQLLIYNAFSESRNCLSLWERWQCASIDGEGEDPNNKKHLQPMLAAGVLLFIRKSYLVP